eukprot:359911-Chlamydomonas_euryale.AAC.1
MAGVQRPTRMCASRRSMPATRRGSSSSHSISKRRRPAARVCCTGREVRGMWSGCGQAAALT